MRLIVKTSLLLFFVNCSNYDNTLDPLVAYPSSSIYNELHLDVHDTIGISLFDSSDKLNQSNIQIFNLENTEKKLYDFRNLDYPKGYTISKVDSLNKKVITIIPHPSSFENGTKFMIDWGSSMIKNDTIEVSYIVSKRTIGINEVYLNDSLVFDLEIELNYPIFFELTKNF